MPATDKLVRWIDLITALLRRRYPVPFAELARDVPDYDHDGAPSEALQRMFERDKDELRRAGIAIETVAGPDGEPSTYRLRATAFYLPYLVLQDAARAPVRSSGAGYRELPTLALTPEDAAVLRRAAERVQALEEPALTTDARGALRKLRYDVAVDGVRRFRTSRMQAVTVNAKAPATRDFTTPSDFDLKQYAQARQAWALGSGDETPITVRFHGTDGDVMTARTIGAASDGFDAAHRTFAVRRRDVFLRWLLSFAGAAVPVHPPDVVQAWPADAHGPATDGGGRMSARAHDQLERLLLALPHLADDTELPLDVLAERVGTDVATLLRDLEALTTRDRDIAGFVESVELYLGPGHVGARTSHFKRPMRLTRAEVAALDLGLGLLMLEKPIDERAAIDHARRLLRAAAVSAPSVVQSGTARTPDIPALPVAVQPVPDALLERFGRLWEAHESRQAVQLRYQRADADEADERVVQPWAIVRAHHHVYVVG
ncbi:MAG: WYL domain-containing protein, partial [Gemmatimonadaceae bacterium]|nr:WYL domain-containing protein [Gemmatimonadaceae bacterium]